MRFPEVDFREPKEIVVRKCDRCGESIFLGDKFVREDDGDCVCKECIDNMTSEELLKEFGYSFEVAEVLDYGGCVF